MDNVNHDKNSKTHKQKEGENAWQIKWPKNHK